VLTSSVIFNSPSAALAALSRCPERYFRLTPYDLAGSRAHARELHRAGLLEISEALQGMIDDGTYGKVLKKWDLEQGAVEKITINSGQ